MGKSASNSIANTTTRITPRSSRNISRRAVPKSIRSASCSMHCCPRLSELHQLVAEIGFPFSVFRHHGRRRAFDKRRIRKLALDRAQFALEARDVLVDAFSLRGFV